MYILNKPKHYTQLLTTLMVVSVCIFNTAHTLPTYTIQPIQQPTDYSFTYLFSHGYGANHSQAAYYSQKYTFIPDRFIMGHNYVITTFDYPDCRYFGTHYMRPTDLGQTKDISALKNAHHALVEKHPDTQIILCGVSRGAATIVNFLSEYNPENIAGIVLESPFYNIESVAEQIAKNLWLSYVPYSTDMVHTMMAKTLVNYKKDGLQPGNAVKNIKNKELPILIICSKQDLLVPWTSSIRLYETFKAEGFKHCHLVILQQGEHSNLLWGADGKRYHDEVQAFYKEYKLPYCG